MRCRIALVIVLLLAASSLVMVESSRAQAKPSVPEFTLSVVACPYDVAPTTTMDPYTGKNVTIQSGYHVENRSIEITVKNQPFSSYKDVNGNSIGLFYNVTFKGNYGDSWNFCFNNPYRGLLNASSSDYTVISMPFGNHHTVPLGGYPLEGITSGKLDFRVQAQIGYYNKSYTGMFSPAGADFYYIFTGQTSDWSSTQTITINESAPSPTPIPTTQTTITPPTTTAPYETPAPTKLVEIPKPAIPEFSLDFTNSSYDVPTTYYIDTFGTGKNETHLGYHVEARNITVTIKNQPFTPYYDASRGWNISLYYNIRIKKHDAQNWTNIYHPEGGYPQADLGSECTKISFQGEYSHISGMDFKSNWRGLMLPAGAQIDFQVQAMIGYIHRVLKPNATSELDFGPYNLADKSSDWGYLYPYVLSGQVSDWSNTQIITISDNTPSSTPSISSPSITTTSSPTQQPTLSPTQKASITPIVDAFPPDNSGFYTLSAVITITAISIVGVLAYLKRQGQL